MDAEKNTRGTCAARTEQATFYRDLQARNERRAKLAQLSDARRRQRVERVMQVARQRRFRARA